MTDFQQRAEVLEFAPVLPDVRLDIYRGEEWINTFAKDVRNGLTASPPELPPKYFYDAVGRDWDSVRYMDLVALSTVWHMAPLRGENRWLLREGLRAIAELG